LNTGKTLAYVLPINERLIAELAAGGGAREAGGAARGPSRGRGRAPSVLVVVPTRELCIQVSRVWTSVAAGRLLLVSVYGGSPMTPQQAKLRAGVDLVVGTPGRLVDLTDRADLRLSSLRVLVLDEADQMLEIGFKDDLEKLFQVVLLHSILCLPGRPSAMHERHEGDSIKDTKETETLQTCMDTQAVIADTTKHGGTHTHQTLLFSATLPSWVQGVARKYLRPDLRADVDLVSGLSLLPLSLLSLSLVSLCRLSLSSLSLFISFSLSLAFALFHS